MKILLTGATGLIGKKLSNELKKLKHTVITVGREQWDALTSSEFPLHLLEDCDAVIHLAGYPIAEKRWSAGVKQKILISRERGTQQIVQAINQKPPRVFICASAVGFYGDRGDEELTENSTAGNDFLAEVVQRWEKAAHAAKSRTVILRSGVVLARDGGALAKMPPVVIGDGKNYLSWIHINDWVNFVIQALSDERYSGVFNLVSPEPVTQAIFIKALAKAKKIPLTLWSPQFALKLGLGQMSEMLLASQKTHPKRAQDLGFRFQFSALATTLKDIYS